MTDIDKRSLSERDICTKFITPALRGAGWDEVHQLREKVTCPKGSIIVHGRLVSRGKATRADYVLYYKSDIPIALMEAKDNRHAIGDGMQQALGYAETPNVPFVFSSNGDGFVLHARTGAGTPRETTIALDALSVTGRALVALPGVDGVGRRPIDPARRWCAVSVRTGRYRHAYA